MPADSTFLSCLLRLQICDRHFRRGDAFAARAFRRFGKRGYVSEFLALGRVEVSAGDIKGGGRGHDHLGSDRERVAFIRASAGRIRRPVIVGRLCQTPWRFTETPYKVPIRSSATGSQSIPSAIETAIPGEFRKAWRTGRCGVGLAKWKSDRRPLRRISRSAPRKSVDKRHTR